MTRFDFKFFSHVLGNADSAVHAESTVKSLTKRVEYCNYENFTCLKPVFPADETWNLNSAASLQTSKKLLFIFQNYSLSPFYVNTRLFL